MFRSLVSCNRVFTMLQTARVIEFSNHTHNYNYKYKRHCLNNSPIHKNETPYSVSGMPQLDLTGKATSFFEFWPAWLMYLPVVVQSLGMAIWHRSLTLPLIANPLLPLSGMVGVGKSELFVQASGECEKAILAWFMHSRSDTDLSVQVDNIRTLMTERDFSYPVVCKPDIGCRGSGVKLVHNDEQLAEVIVCYPIGALMMVQQRSQFEPEAGVFFVKDPTQTDGVIISLALKYMPYVVGDGSKTLRELIASDPRAGQLQHLYFDRHQHMLASIIPAGEPYRLIFAASHSRGAIFRDARELITPELTRRINQIMTDLPHFYYGRMDIKFKDVASLRNGEHIEIVEINSASSESLHIWDRNASLLTAISSLLFQYRTLYRLGAENRRLGFKPPKFTELMVAWKKERILTQAHPQTD